MRRYIQLKYRIVNVLFFLKSFVTLTLCTNPLNYLCNLLSKSSMNMNTIFSVSTSIVFFANTIGNTLQKFEIYINIVLDISTVIAIPAVKGILVANESISIKLIHTFYYSLIML